MDETQKQLLELKRLKVHRLQNEQYRYYTPIGKGEEFINKIGSGKYIVTLLSAANGIGKTFLAVNLLANLFWPNDNKFFQQDLFKKFPYKKQGRIISDPTTVIKTIIPALKLIFPKGRYGASKYSTTKEGKRFESSWKTDTGWEFDIMTYEQDIKEFESATLGFVWFDEPPPEAIYKASISRLRLGGLSWITATPLSGSAWMYDEIITNPNNEAGYRSFVEADVEAACSEHGVRGFLDHEQILRMIAQYSEEDKQARIFGKFQHLTGLVFKTFSRKIHVIRPFRLSPQDWCVAEYLDPHPRNPDAVMWVAQNKKGVKIVVAEVYEKFKKTFELAERIKEVGSPFRIEDRYADRLAWNIDQHRTFGAGAVNLATELAELGLDYTPASKERANGIRMVQSALDYQLESGTDEILQPPMLYVFDTCPRTIWEFEHWQYNEYTGKAAEKHGESEKPQDKDDHMMENLGRSFLNDTGFVFRRQDDILPQNHPLSTTRGAMESSPNLDPFA